MAGGETGSSTGSGRTGLESIRSRCLRRVRARTPRPERLLGHVARVVRSRRHRRRRRPAWGPGRLRPSPVRRLGHAERSARDRRRPGARRVASPDCRAGHRLDADRERRVARTRAEATCLDGGGGGGGGGNWETEYWVWPLPPPGPFAFVCEWPAKGIPLTRKEIDAQAMRDAAAQAETLWEDPTSRGRAARCHLRGGGSSPPQDFEEFLFR